MKIARLLLDSPKAMVNVAHNAMSKIIPNTTYKTAHKNSIIQNHDLPGCTRCIYYKPVVGFPFVSALSECTKYGLRDAVTDKITYIQVGSCRGNENRCGKEGKHFEEEPYPGIIKIRHFTKSYWFLFVLLPINIWCIKTTCNIINTNRDNSI